MTTDPKKWQDNTTESEEATGKSERTVVGSARRHDARYDKNQLKKNQERLGVSADHKTPAMKKYRRGTYP